MNDSASGARYVRFGAFELDLRSNELRKGPTCLKVPDQSIEILKALLEQPGELVTREALGQRLWPANHYVDFEHGLNAAVRRLRDALGDSASNPKFIETLRRRGYRFVGTLDAQPLTSPLSHSQVVVAREVPTRLAVPNLPPVWLWRPIALVVASTAVALLSSVGAEWMSWPVPPPAPPAPIFKDLTLDRGSWSGPTLSDDGRFVVFRSELNGRVTFWTRPCHPLDQTHHTLIVNIANCL